VIDTGAAPEVEMARRRTPAEPDPVEQASVESFPASDPPAWVPVHAGAPAGDAPAGAADPAVQVWNSAVEEAARVVERAKAGRSRGLLCADIRQIKRPERN
jgi:hypothetical protein